tara:strand:+ start:684 stop:971 length:288 start_codon:yes stop_codon:yes gene_type:complete
MVEHSGGKAIGGIMGIRIKFGSEGPGSGRGKPQKNSRNSMKSILYKRGRRAKQVTHEEIDEALDRFLKSGGKIEVLPETWHNIHRSEKMLWGFEG